MDWHDVFVKRKTELDWLITKWNLAKEGEPQFVVLLGEPGFGKTRIALEFYRWLTCNEDPPSAEHSEGYWPDAFVQDHESLDVNPRFNEGEPRRGKIPWLWSEHYPHLFRSFTFC